jgi:hypothetical protein
MERICTQCHAVLADCHADLADQIKADWCAACGGALTVREPLPTSRESDHGPAVVEVDHRGIVLPRRHAMGGIITPV